jgi:hypothetical protein
VSSGTSKEARHLGVNRHGLAAPQLPGASQSSPPAHEQRVLTETQRRDAQAGPPKQAVFIERRERLSLKRVLCRHPMMDPPPVFLHRQAQILRSVSATGV